MYMYMYMYVFKITTLTCVHMHCYQNIVCKRSLHKLLTCTCILSRINGEISQISIPLQYPLHS